VAGAEISSIPLAPLKVMLQQGPAGIPSLLMGAVMTLMGLSMWFSPQYRALAGIVTVLLAAAALVLSNLGGFLFGTVLGIVGGSLAFAWQTHPPPDPAPRAEPPHKEEQADGPIPDTGASGRTADSPA
jgi:hypothetical protein